MQHNVLVTYATRYGSTSDVAEGVAEVLREHFGVHTIVSNVKDVNNIEAYDTVILGSSIFADRWLPEADRFLQRFQSELETNRKVAFFITCMTVEKEPKESARKITTYVADLHRHAIKPDVIGVFGGKIDHSLLTEMEQYMTVIKRLPDGDQRDWSQIREWAVMAGEKLFA